MMNTVIRISAAACVGYAALMLLVFLLQHRIIFFPQQLSENFQFRFQEKFIESYLDISDQKKVHYLRFLVDQPQGVILFFHGNAGALDGWGYVAEELAKKTQHEIWIMDYPGFGKSTGSLEKSEQGLIKMGEMFIKKIRELHSDLPLYLYGRSIGSGIAAGLSRQSGVAGIILETPYTSLKQLATELYPWLPSFLLRFDLDNTKIKDSPIKNVLIFHGTDDAVIPFQHGHKLSQILEGRSKLIRIEGGTHNDLSDFPAYWQALTDYLTNHPATSHRRDVALTDEVLFQSRNLTKSGLFTRGIEGPAVSPEGDLYVVNFQKQGTIGVIRGVTRNDQEASLFLQLPEDGISNAIRFNPQGEMLVADRKLHRILKIDRQTKEITILAENRDMNQPNDFCVSQSGALFISDPSWSRTKPGTIYLFHNSQLTELAPDMKAVNGIDLSPDESKLYISESDRKSVV